MMKPDYLRLATLAGRLSDRAAVRLGGTCVLALLGWLAVALPCSADVFVLSNRTLDSINVQVSPEVARPYYVRLATGEVRTLFSDDRLQIAFDAGNGRESYLLDANRAYYFGVSAAGRIGMSRVGLGGDASTAEGRRLPGDANPESLAVVTVKILVDDDEPTRRVLWERKLRDRIAEASKILSRHSAVELRVVDVGRWVSDNQKVEFTESLREFERLVDPAPARLAIGFTSQYEARRGRVHLGGTRGPLRRHIMLREWSRKVSEKERLELLVHEVGHFLGATHSPQRDSVMRPVLGDQQSRRRGFDIRFDAANSLIIGMVGEEMRRRGVDQFGHLTVDTRRRLNQVYGSLAKAMPKDPSSKHFLEWSRVGRTAKPASKDAAALTRRVLNAVVATARRNRAPTNAEPLAGDALMERYVRVAAASAATMPEAEGRQAFLLGLGVAVDTTGALRELPITKAAVAAAESPDQRAARLEVFGKPTVAGRADLAKHFFVSAHLTAATDAKTADQLGMSKEALDSQGGTGYSFADIAANRAGIRFAKSVLAGRPTLDFLAREFRMAIYMPSIKGLPEGLTSSQLLEQFGGPGDQRFEKQLAEIDRRINALPPYLMASPALLGPTLGAPAGGR